MKYIKKRNITIGCTILFISMLLPYIVASFYATPAADDFSYINDFEKMLQGSNYWKALLDITSKTYISWQGTYFGTFLSYVLVIFAQGNLKKMELMFCSVIILFFISIFSLIKNVLKYIFNYDSVIATILFSVMLFVGFIFRVDTSETFYWYTTLGLYTIPTIFSFLTITFVLKSIKENEKKYFAVSLVFSIFAVGGTLQVTAFTCLCLLGNVIRSWFINKEMRKAVIVFLIALTGGLINSFAPGNFSRHDNIDSELHFFKAVFLAGKELTEIMYHHITGGPLILLLIITFFMGIYLAKRNSITYRYPVFVLGYLIVGMIVVAFPVKLAYGEGYFPPRCTFQQNIALGFALLGGVLYVAGWFERKNSIIFTKEIILCLIITIIIGATNVMQTQSIMGYTPVKIVKNLVDGKLLACKRDYLEIESILRSNTRKDVILKKVPDTAEIFCPLGLSTDKKMWVNTAMAEFFGNKSIKIKE